MKSIKDLRDETYEYHRKYYSYIFDEWKWYSYRKFKATLYMEFGPYIAYFFMRAGIKPNTMTVIYAMMGLLAGIFIATPSKSLILVGVLFFYSRSFIDWSDGLLARSTNQTSVTGAILDPYGALVGWVSLWTGMAYYVTNKSVESALFLSPDVSTLSTWLVSHIIYVAPILPAIFALDLIKQSRSELFSNFINKDTKEKIHASSKKEDFRSTKAKYKIEFDHPLISKTVRSIHQLFEHNSRTIDTICLIILVETFYPVFISWIIYILFLLWQIVIFSGTFYMVAKGGWAEQELEGKFS